MISSLMRGLLPPAILVVLRFLGVAVSFSLCLCCAARAQAVDALQTTPRDVSSSASANLVYLPSHHPGWASSVNDEGPLNSEEKLDSMTLVLQRSQEQETALEQLLKTQQDPESSDYHRWLTPNEFSKRFGLGAESLASVEEWLRTNDLVVRWVAPGGNFIGFSGSAGATGRAFHTHMHRYRVHGVERLSADSDPAVPRSVAGLIRSVRGLYTIEDAPMHSAGTMASASPEVSVGNGVHFLGPVDFDTIYDVPSVAAGTSSATQYSGLGETIGIVGRSRIAASDITNLADLTLFTIPIPEEIVPTAFGGVDPGPAYTSPPPSGVSLGDQLEATLDGMRAGSVAPFAQVLLIVATNESGGIGVDAQYLVQTTPVPVQTMNISFGSCEASAGPAGVAYWDELFQQGASEGISVFVSAGDSGASGCDQDFSTPPATPLPNSPNYICSSSYATCVGGTEFADTAAPSEYWTSNNGTNLNTALQYIPEGGWNEPLDSQSLPHVAAGGGGVSQVIATPSWQIGTGVPAARAGRYTPDLAFSASAHDGYFACFAAAGASCEADANGNYDFEYFFGTSAAAPSMAGITALLNQQLGTPLGNLNPQLYQLAASSPKVFHDVTVATSGVTSCSVNTPSMCNNSIPGLTGLSGGQAGFEVTAGYDQVTGLGSLDVLNFLNSYTYAKSTPTMTLQLSPSAAITTVQILKVTITVTGVQSETPTGTVVITTGAYTSVPSSLTGGTTVVAIPAGQLASGSDKLIATYTPDSGTYNSASASTTVVVTAVAPVAPAVTINAAPQNATTAQSIMTTVNLSGSAGLQPPTGTITLTSGSNVSYSTTLQSGSTSASFMIPALTLPVGTDVLNATYAPDAVAAPVYAGATASTKVTITAATKVAPSVSVSFSQSPITVAQSLQVMVVVNGGDGYAIPSGTVVLSGGGYLSAPASLFPGTATLTVPAGALAIGSDSLTVTYTPDSTDSAIYLSSSGSAIVKVTAVPLITPIVNVLASSTITASQTLETQVIVNSAGASNLTPSGTVILSSGSYTSPGVALATGSATISIPAGALPVGADKLTAAYDPDTASASVFSAASGTSVVTVTPAVPPSFTLGASGVTLSPGSTTANTSTITLTSDGEFSGSVTLSATISSSPTGAQDLPALSFGSSSPVALSNSGSAAATLTITTTAPTSGRLSSPADRVSPWLTGGGTCLACMWLWISRRRRILLRSFGMVLLFGALVSGLIACGGGSKGGSGTPGTTAGNYTVKVTGISGATSVSNTFTLTVQ